MGIWKRGVVVRRTCYGRKKGLNSRHHGRSIERKLRQLQRLIPGGRAADTEALFQKIAIYIFLLESRVKADRSGTPSP
ncbi:hypothetical protein CTI12_AA270080 [Artemisia annua]|uniref:Myc-type, basic helix-loop-helix (BHLH) domain-containing protein n=1 Tax=Artemisia annua TaxID=35608 RepID=A0A2U1NGA3_ARTAN|nr:hypothetical protein CTI12_AA270080 [Artemisia annua]